MIPENKVFIGIDVSKATLDISISGRHFKIENSEKTLNSFISEAILDKQIEPELVCLESTGGYEIDAIRCFQRAKMPIHRAHPNKVYSFAKASGHFAKTDKLDAKLLEKYAAFVCDKEKGDHPRSDDAYELRELRNIERNLMEDLHAAQCRIKNSHGRATAHIQSQIDFIKEQLNKVRKDIDEVIKSDADLDQKQKLLTSYKGIGKRIASVLLSELPELGMLDNKAIASLAGVAPKTYESGIKSRVGHIFGGRFYVRKALYMAALVASRHNKQMKVVYERLIAVGKKPKVALVAIMRKIVICLNVMLRNKASFQEPLSKMALAVSSLAKVMPTAAKPTMSLF